MKFAPKLKRSAFRIFLAPKQNGSASRISFSAYMSGKFFHNITKYMHIEFLLFKSHFIYSNT